MNNEISRIYILKFNKVNEAPKEFWDLVKECIEIGKDEDYIRAMEEYNKNPDKTIFIVECDGDKPGDNPKNQAYRRGMWFKDKLKKINLLCPYFQVFKKRNKK